MKRACIIFRANGGNRIGHGHLMRCDALSSVLKAEFNCVLFTEASGLEVINNITHHFTEVCCVTGMLETDRPQYQARDSIAAVVLDGYDFTEADQHTLQAWGYPVVCIDDLHQLSFSCEAIINHAGGVTPDHYRASAWTQFYLGPAYRILRRPFLEAVRRDSTAGNNDILICMGGADPQNHTVRILTQMLEKYPTANYHLVIGTSYAHRAALDTHVQASGKKIELHQGLSAAQMLQLMERCGMAVCSASTIAYEYLSVGGQLWVCQTADNQRDLFRYLIDSGLALAFPATAAPADDATVHQMLEKQKQIFAGNPQRHLFKIFSTLALRQRTKIRKVDAGDKDILLAWANDGLTRSQSYNAQKITLEAHDAWFQEALQNKDLWLFMLVHDGTPCAHIRFRITDHTATISYVVSPAHRGTGMGTLTLSMGMQQFLTTYRKPVTVAGYVKNSNVASQRSFERFNFHREVATAYQDSFIYTLRYEPDTTGR